VDTALRIQVRIEARKALTELRALTAAANQLKKAQGSGGGGGGGSTRSGFAGNGPFAMPKNSIPQYRSQLASLRALQKQHEAEMEASRKAASAVQLADDKRRQHAAETMAKDSIRKLAAADKERVAAAKQAVRQQTQADRQAAMEARKAAQVEEQVARKRAAELNAIRKQEAATEKATLAQKARTAAALARKQAAEEVAAARGSGTGGGAALQQMTLMRRASIALTGEMGQSKRGMLAFGKDLQWVGRQLNFNFTIPLLAAGTAAMGWALDNEKAWTRVEKVYGDGLSDYTADLTKLRHGMRLLSDIYGNSNAEVNELAASWAAAGAEGAALGKSVESNLRLGILGDYEDLNDAFTDLITVQGAFQLTAGQTAFAIAELNTVENMTAVGMQDLTKAVALAGGSAYVAGVSLEELAAHVALLVPVTGSAARAGNALKTIYSRLVAPTVEMIEALDAMGIAFYDASFQALDGAGRLEAVADKYKDLSDAQKAYVGSVIGSREQFNRFVTLIEGIINKESAYHKVMEALDPKNAAQNMQRANEEIQTLLESDPRKIEILGTQIKNMLTDAIIPMIPALIGVLQMVRDLFQWFSNLDPAIQQWTFGVLGAIIAVGILAQALGSAQILLATLLRPIVFLGLALERMLIPALAMAGRAVVFLFATPWGLAILGAAALAYVFRDQVMDGIGGAISFVQRGFNLLPQSIQRALTGVINVVAAGIRIIRELLSYLNPFQRHSPSLVDNVKAGVAVIAKEYASLTGIGSTFQKSIADMEAFAAATAAARAAAQSGERSEQREQITSIAPDSGPSLDALYADLDGLNATLASLRPGVDSQSAAVAELRAQLDAADDAVDRFDSSLDPLRTSVSDLKDGIDEANDTIDKLASMPLTGMRAMSDAIFENEQAQKRLRLEMLRMGESGESYEEIQDRIARLNGDIEMLRGKMTDLRSSGAGSDVLGVYQKELEALEAQRDGLRASGGVSDTLSKQLEELQKQGEILDLEESLQFDPMLRKIEQLANGLEEMSFDNIVAGIKEQQGVVAALTPEYERQTAALEDQEAVLSRMEAARDQLKVAYEAEETKLVALKNEYQLVEEQIRSIEQAIADLVSAYKDLTDAAAGADAGGGAGANFDALGAGEFEENPMPSFGEEMDLDSLIAEWEAQLKASFDSFAPFEKIKEKFEELKSWWYGTALPFLETMKGYLSTGWNTSIDFLSGIKVDPAALLGQLGEIFGDLWSKVPGADQISEGFAYLFGDIPETLSGIFDATVEAIADVIDGLAEFGPVIKPLLKVIGFLAGVLAVVFKPFMDNFLRMFKPTITLIGTLIKGAFEIIAGVIGAIVQVLTGDFGAAWESVKTIFLGIGTIIGGVATFIWEVIGAMTQFIADIAGMVATLAGLGWDAGVNIFQGLIDGMVGAATAAWDWITGWFDDAIQAVKDLLGIKSPSTVFSDIGVDLMLGLLEGLAKKAVEVMAWFIKLPGEILGWIGSVTATLVGKGVDLILGLWNGITQKALDVTNWFIALPGRIVGFVGDVLGTLRQKGLDLVGGLKSGVDFAWTAVTAWFSSIGSFLVTAAGDLLGTLTQKGKDLIGGLFGGVIDSWLALKEWIGSIGTFVANAAGDTFGALKQKGKDLINGFKEGVKEAWNSFANWFNAKVGGMEIKIPGIFGWGGKTIGMPDMPTFHTGGIVPGMGDVAAIVRAGEMVLTATQQANLFALANKGAAAAPVAHQSKVINFYGDLSFPNIKTADDADRFIDNLELLSG
jgi:TP901 family phage tail tape measure protein